MLFLSSKPKHTTAGFTLVEVLVAIALFTIVVSTSVGALITMLDANRKAQSISITINNAFFAFENLTRLMRTGLYYHCGSDGGSKTSDRDLTNDCPGGDTAISFIDDRAKLVRVRMEESGGFGAVMMQTEGEPEYALTSDDFDVNVLRFYVSDSEPGVTNAKQPKTTIVLEGIANEGAPEQSELKLQSTVTQRTIDI